MITHLMPQLKAGQTEHPQSRPKAQADAPQGAHGEWMEILRNKTAKGK